jgi:hypothetical protein
MNNPPPHLKPCKETPRVNAPPCVCVCKESFSPPPIPPPPPICGALQKKKKKKKNTPLRFGKANPKRPNERKAKRAQGQTIAP